MFVRLSCLRKCYFYSLNNGLTELVVDHSDRNFKINLCEYYFYKSHITTYRRFGNIKILFTCILWSFAHTEEIDSVTAALTSFELK